MEMNYKDSRKNIMFGIYEYIHKAKLLTETIHCEK
jgi:chromatin remodeling complex protein RSC6